MPVPAMSRFSRTFHQVGSYHAAAAWEQLKTYEEHRRPQAGR